MSVKDGILMRRCKYKILCMTVFGLTVLACMTLGGVRAIAQCAAAPPGSGTKLCYPPTGTPVPVCGGGALSDALSRALPGQHIQLCTGTYGGTFTYNKNGTATAPIVIEPQNGATVVFTGRFDISGTYGVFKGMQWRGAQINLTGKYNRITRNFFTGHMGGNTINMEGGHAYNRVDHNEFRAWSGPALEDDGIRNASDHPGITIDYNYFVDHQAPAENESVALFLSDAYHPSGLFYEYNVFDNVLQGRAGEAEVISVKTGQVTIRGNTFMNSGKIDLSLRETNGTLVEGNCFLNGAGISAFGDDNIIKGNKLEGGGKIDVRSGDTYMDTHECPLPKFVSTVLIGSNCVAGHAGSRRPQISDNVGPITLGDHYNYTPPHPVRPVLDATLTNNSGPVNFVTGLNAGFNSGTTYTPGTPNPTALCLTPTQVGQDVADASCPGN
jgi:hypothetical protein